MTILRITAVDRIHDSGDTAVQALTRVNLTVEIGELVAVMGPSGSGKSTLLNIAGGLDSPTTGTVEVEGVNLASLSRRELARVRRRSVGYVFQDFNLISSLTAIENVSLPLELDGIPLRKARYAAATALDDVGLRDVSQRFPDQLSGGQQQRIAIARSVVGERRLVLADEPTGALDTRTGEAVLKLFRRLCDNGAGGILVTHDARHAGWADRVVYLRDGQVIDSTDPLTRPESLLGYQP